MLQDQHQVQVKNFVTKKTALRTQIQNHNDVGERVSASQHKSCASTLSYQDIKEMGGIKADLDVITSVDDNSEIEDLEFDDDMDTEPISKDAILSYIKELGIKKWRPESVSADPADKSPKVKLLSSEYHEEEVTVGAPVKKISKNKFKAEESPTACSGGPEEGIARDAHDTIESLGTYIKSGYKKRTQPLVKPGRWLAQLQTKDHPVSTGKPHPRTSEIEAFSKTVLEDDVELSQKSKSAAELSSSDWMRKVISSGTLTDRGAALTTIIQEDPIHSLSTLENMVNLTNKKDRRESLTAIGHLKDLFLDLLPNKRKLRAFSQMPLDTLNVVSGGNKDTQDRQLALWFFESELKRLYERFVDSLLAAMFDTVVASKLQAVKIVLELLIAKPEQEQKLLAGLVNKLGDPERKVAANAAYLLTKLVRKHPNMKTVVCSEVENILYRPHINKKAQYYAVCFLNQVLLSEEDEDLAVKLIVIYFSFFKASIKQNEMDTKLMSALLIGVYRAFPFAKGSEKLALEDQISSIYKIVHTVKFNICLQALMLLYQVCDSGESVSDRYYVALYSKLLDPGLSVSSKQPQFLNLLYKSMKNDPSERRCKAFIKRLLQVASTLNPTFICSSLIIISEVVKLRPGVICLKSAAQDNEDSDVEHFIDDDEQDADTNRDKSPQKNTIGHASWQHIDSRSTAEYNPVARNPLYSCADKAVETELASLSHHYHPSVSVFSKSLLQGQQVVYSGDPLTDFSLQKFLDRFVFRNPKKVFKTDQAQGKLSARQKNVKAASLPVNSDDFFKLDKEAVPADERFFHSYFHKLALGSQQKPTKKKQDVEDDAEVSDDDFDDYLTKYESNLFKSVKHDSLGADFARDFQKGKMEVRPPEEEASDSEDEDLDGSEGELNDEEFDMDLDAGDFDLDLDDMAGDSKEGAERSPGGNSDQDEDDGDQWEEEIEFSDQEDSLEGVPPQEKSLTKAQKEVRKRIANSGSLFAAADEFADLIEEDSRGGDTITSRALINKDRAAAKQLAWEDKRERWMKGDRRRQPVKRKFNTRPVGGKKKIKNR